MSNKYTLKDPYKWEIHRSNYYKNVVNLAVVYSGDGKKVIQKIQTIPSPGVFNAKGNIVKAMDDIKNSNPELFEDYDDITDTFNAALAKIETLSDIQLSEILHRAQ